MGIFEKRPQSVQLQLPKPMGEVLKFPTILTKKREQKREQSQAFEFAKEADEMAQSGAFNARARAYVAELLPAVIPKGVRVDVEAWQELTSKPVTFAICCAEVEAAKGWQTPGEIDGRVSFILDRLITNHIHGLDFNEGQLLAFLIEAAYYHARTGDHGMDQLKRVQLNVVRPE